MLFWNYEVQPGLMGFQIYRSMIGAPFRAYKLASRKAFNSIQNLNMLDFANTNSISNTKFAIIDVDLIKNKKVKYKIVAKYYKGSYSSFSEEKFLNVFK